MAVPWAAESICMARKRFEQTLVTQENGTVHRTQETWVPAMLHFTALLFPYIDRHYYYAQLTDRETEAQKSLTTE